MNNPVQRPGSMLPFYLGLAFALLVVGGLGYEHWQRMAGAKAVDEWVHTYPTNAMVLEKHPSTLPRFTQHFMNYYMKSGKAGLAEGQIEMQQIMNVNYLTDYLWTMKDLQLREYLKQQYFLVAALTKQSNGQSGLCEQYFGNSALYAQVDKAIGGGIFKAYMTASENLMLSAKDNRPYGINPQNANYYTYLDRAKSNFWNKYRSQHPGLSYEELQRRSASFNFLVSCAGYADYVRTLLQLDDLEMSLMWRGSQEAGRAEAEALRRLHGSE